MGIKQAAIQEGDLPAGTPVALRFDSLLKQIKPGDVIVTKPTLAVTNYLHRGIEAFQRLRGKEMSRWTHTAIAVGDGNIIHASKGIKGGKMHDDPGHVRQHTLKAFVGAGRDVLVLRPQVSKEEKAEAIARATDLKGVAFSKADIIRSGFAPAKKEEGELKQPPPDAIICTGTVAYSYPTIEFSKSTSYKNLMPADIASAKTLKPIVAYSKEVSK